MKGFLRSWKKRPSKYRSYPPKRNYSGTWC